MKFTPSPQGRNERSEGTRGSSRFSTGSQAKGLHESNAERRPETSRSWFPSMVTGVVVASAVVFAFADPADLDTVPGAAAKPLPTKPLVLEKPPAAACYRIALEESDSRIKGGLSAPASLGWSTSGLWWDSQKSGGGKELLLVDAAFKRIARATPAVSSSLAATGLTSLRDSRSGASVPINRPNYIYPRPGGGFAVLDQRADPGVFGGKPGGDGAPAILLVNEHGEIDSALRTRNVTLTNNLGGTVNSNGIFRMAPVDQTNVFVFGDFERTSSTGDGNRYFSSFAWLATDGQAVTYHPVGPEVPEPLQEMFTRDLSFIASLEGEAYLLMLDENPWVGRAQVGSSDIERLEGYETDLTCPTFERPAETSGTRERVIQWIYDLYESLELSDMPVGLVTWQERLFVVEKGAKGRDGTAWFLNEISQDDGSSRQRLRLPTQAPHIILIAGDEELGILEKGPISTIGSAPERILYRETRSAVVLPASWLGQASALETQSAVECPLVDHRT